MNTNGKPWWMQMFYRITEVRRLLGVGAVIVFVTMSLTAKWDANIAKDMCLMIISYYVGAKTAMSSSNGNNGNNNGNNGD